jgi:hypothetical protein
MVIEEPSSAVGTLDVQFQLSSSFVGDHTPVGARVGARGCWSGLHATQGCLVSTTNDNASAVAAAIEFVAAQAGGAERILKLHYSLPDSGMCAGCRVVPTRHPCTAARIAQLAKKLSNDRGKCRDLDIPDVAHSFLARRTVEYWRQLAVEFWGKS